MPGTARSYLRHPPKQIAGARVLDFVNTVEWRGAAPDERIERLTGFDELIAWCRLTALVGEEEGAALAAAAAAEPARARAALQDAVSFREAAAEILSGTPGAGDAALRLNGLLRRLAIVWRVEAAAGAPSIASVPPESALDRPLQALLAEFVALLQDDAHRRIRHCANPACGWVFIDQSRTGRRRWCEMASCGNQAKARRHYARAKGARGQGRCEAS